MYITRASGLRARKESMMPRPTLAANMRLGSERLSPPRREGQCATITLTVSPSSRPVTTNWSPRAECRVLRIMHAVRPVVQQGEVLGVVNEGHVHPAAVRTVVMHYAVTAAGQWGRAQQVLQHSTVLHLAQAHGHQAFRENIRAQFTDHLGMVQQLFPVAFRVPLLGAARQKFRIVVGGRPACRTGSPSSRTRCNAGCIAPPRSGRWPHARCRGTGTAGRVVGSASCGRVRGRQVIPPWPLWARLPSFAS
jgi:hypothetical protein